MYQGRAFEVQQVGMRLPDGREVTYDLVKHPGAITIVPIDADGNVWFVRQYRVGCGETLLELPAGTLEPGEAPDLAAAREVREEIGMAASLIKKVGEFYLAPGYSSEFMHVYLATGLSDDPLPGDDDEFLNAEAVPLEEAFRMAESGQLRDGKSLAALLLVRAHLDKQ